MAEKKDELNYIPSINSTALPKDGQDNANFYPALNSQQILDGQYVQFESMPNRSLVELANVDKKYVAGQDIKAGKTAGIWGFITEVTSAIAALGATYGDAGDAGTVKDGNEIIIHDASGATEKHGFISWSNAPAKPSGTGITILTVEVRIQGTMFSGNTNQPIIINDLVASFDETTLTWNNKPSFGGSIAAKEYANGAFDTGFFIVTEAEYDNIRDNGIGMDYDGDNGASAIWGDEDNATPPTLDVRFIYKVQNGDVFLSSGLTTEQADGFRGIAQNDAVKGQSIILRQEGIDDNHLTGLTPFEDYQLSDTPGEIQIGTSATSDKVIGNARSTTSLHIKYVLNDAT